MGAVLVPRARVEDLQRFLTSVNDGLFHLPAGVDLPAAIGFGDGDVQPLLISPIPVAPVEVQQTPVQAIRDVDKGADRD